jgi:hypothetical protein
MLVIVGAVLFGAAPALADGFVAGLEDLPLMTGLQEVGESAVTFDVPEGRIVEVYAEGAVDGGRVLAFYDETLPQLGWTLEGAGRFRREGELLHIEIISEGEGTAVRFSLAPG